MSQSQIQPPPISAHLPFDIRAALVRASQVSTDIDPLARVKAIDHVLRRAKANHPKYFKD